ncbi:hypothetical protein MNBD_GAMMA12-933 [hydrothermal vent metagenome]|uniref:Phosphate ABC transporter substrate-binding protein n=1 Tax=hydrothermal vent metagenome TaxID=652676 RepID=A0A3B0ZAL7_9ZZZZ
MNLLTLRISRSLKALLALVVFGLCGASYAEVVLIVSSKSSVGALSKDEVKKIYLLKSKKLTPLVLKSSMAAHAEFRDKVISKTESQLTSYWSRLVFSGRGEAPKEFSDEDSMVKHVKSNSETIGYVTRKSVTSGVKVVLTVP